MFKNTGIDRYYYPQEEHEDTTFIMINPDLLLIITPDTVFIHALQKEMIETVKGMLYFHHQLFDQFLERYKDTAVPHELYISLLRGWFPGLVHMRELETD